MKENIERTFNNLAKGQSTTPPSFVWDNIEEVLHPKPRSRFGILLFFGLFTGIVIAGVIGYDWDKIEVVQNTQEAESNSIEKGISHLNSIKVNEEKSNAVAVVKSTTAMSSTSDIQPSLAFKNKANNSSKIAKSSVSDISEELNKNQNTLINNATLNNNNNNNNNNNKNNNNSGSGNSNIVSLSPLHTDQSIRNIHLSKLSFLSISKLVNDDFSLYQIKDDVVCPSFNSSKKINAFATLGLFGGSHSKSIADGENSTLAAKRNLSESSWYSYGISASAGINFSPFVYVGVGIDWTQSKDKFYVESEAITKMIITFDPNNGQPIDTSFVTGKLVNKGEIRYNSLDIPLFIGFHKQINTWAFGVEVGALVNVNFNAKGKIYNEALSITRIENEPVVYKNSLNLGIKAALVVRKQLSNGLSLEFKPTFKTYLSNINDPAYSLPMKMSVFGLNVGLRKDF